MYKPNFLSIDSDVDIFHEWKSNVAYLKIHSILHKRDYKVSIFCDFRTFDAIQKSTNPVADPTIWPCFIVQAFSINWKDEERCTSYSS